MERKKKRQPKEIIKLKIISLPRSVLLGHGSKYWIVTTYARPILLIVLLCVTYLIELRLLGWKERASGQFRREEEREGGERREGGREREGRREERGREGGRREEREGGRERGRREEREGGGHNEIETYCAS